MVTEELLLHCLGCGSNEDLHFPTPLRLLLGIWITYLFEFPQKTGPTPAHSPNIQQNDTKVRHILYKGSMCYKVVSWFNLMDRRTRFLRLIIIDGKPCCRSAPTDAITSWIEETMQQGPVVKQSFMGGSSWSSAYVYETADGAKYFIKMARSSSPEMFQGEALGLQAMRDCQLSNPEEDRLKIPQVFHHGSLPGNRGSFIVMEHFDFSGRASAAELGRRLAHMHLAEPIVSSSTWSQLYDSNVHFLFRVLY